MILLGSTSFEWELSPNSLASCEMCGSQIGKGQARLKKETEDFGGTKRYTCRSCVSVKWKQKLAKLEQEYKELTGAKKTVGKGKYHKKSGRR